MSFSHVFHFSCCLDFREEFEALAVALPLCSSLTTFKIQPRAEAKELPSVAALAPLMSALRLCKNLTALNMIILYLQTAADLIVIEHMSATLLQLPSLSELELGFNWDSYHGEAALSSYWPSFCNALGQLSRYAAFALVIGI